MSNELVTKFVFDDASANQRIELTEKRLNSLDTRLNGLGQNPTFGRGLNNFFDALNKKVNQFETNLQSAGKTDLKSLGNDLLKQAQIEKSLEQTKRAKLQSATEEVRLERQKLGLQSDQLKIERERQSLQSRTNSSSASGFRAITTDISKNLNKDFIQSEREKAKEVAAINAQTKANAKAQADFRAAMARRSADAEINEEKRVDRYRQQSARDFAARIFRGNGGGTGGNGNGNSVRDVASSIGLGSLTGIGLAGGITAAIYGAKQFIDVSKAAIDKSVESARANRLLASSATEAGTAYGILAEKNKKYAELLGLSDVATARTTARVQQLATFSGRPQDFDKLSAGFADLGAAKGIDSRDLETLIGTILSGQDEGLNRLGISDPGQLYKAYAKELGTTSDKLSQFQKVQAAVNAVVDKSAIFKGTAEARMNSLEGQTARTSAQFDNFTTSLSKSFTQSYTFNSILTSTSKLMKQLTYDTDTLQKKLSEGKLTQKDISEAAAPGFIAREGGAVIRGFSTFMSGFASLPEVLSGGLFDPFAESSRKFAEIAQEQNPELQQQLREDYLRQQLNAQIRLDAAQKKAAEEQNKNLAEINAKEAKRIENLQKQSDLLEFFKNPRSSTTDISNRLQSLRNGNIFADADSTFSETENKKLIEAGEREISDRTARTYQRVLSSEKNNLNELRRELGNIASDPRLFFEQRENLTASFEQKIKDVSKSLISLKNDFRETLITNASQEFPLIRQMADFETATERAKAKFGAFGDSVVNKIAAIERANLTKAINLKNFENNFAALKFDQDARRLAATPERQFADFTRKLERINRQVDFVSTNNDLTRKISEADYYANQFNPNNPKSFAEFNRRGPNDDFSDAGVNIRNAVSDIRDLKSISLEGTGLDGREAIINKILETIPPREELLKRLNSPNLRGESQSLLAEQAQALRIKRDIERNKFDNFLEDQRTAEFGKVFAREQIGLINGSSLTDKEKAEQRLAVTNALGNDLDPALKRQAIQDSVTSANEKRNEEKKTAQNIQDLKDLVAALVKQLAEKGINPEVPPAQVNLTLNGVEATVSQNPLPKSATSADVEEAYFNENDPNYRIGDSHKAGIYYGAKLR